MGGWVGRGDQGSSNEVLESMGKWVGGWVDLYLSVAEVVCGHVQETTEDVGTHVFGGDDLWVGG